MSVVMMALGGYRFSVATAAYQDLDRNSDYRWASAERIGKDNALQFTGPGEETISLSGTILPHYRGGLGQLDAMRAEAAKGKPLILVDGLGRVWGKYCITKVHERQSAFLSVGAPLKVEFGLDLKKYGGDEETGP